MIQRLKNLLIPSGQKRNVKVMQTWEVRWWSRHNKWDSDGRPEIRVFTIEREAEQFKNQLKQAFKLIKYTYGDYVEMEETHV